jgi:hypothetical protein
MSRPSAFRPALRARAAQHLMVLVCAGVSLVGCKKRADAPSGPGGGMSRATVDVTADREVIKTGWLVALAKDPAALATLASSSAGWRAFFGGDAAAALAAFEKDLETGAPARIGAARAALELADAHRWLARTQAVATGSLLQAQATRPGARKSAAVRAFILARLAGVQGNVPDFSPAEADPAIAELVASARPGATGPAAALMSGTAGGADAPAPAGMSAAYERRLRTRSLVAAGRLAEARRLWKSVDPKAPDLIAGSGDDAVSVRDPQAALGAHELYAAIALESLGTLDGWTDLLRARALLILKRGPASAERLQALLAKPPVDAALAQLVLSGTTGPADLAHEAVALWAVSLAAGGDAEGAKAKAGTLPEATVRQRVLKAWALAFAGVTIKPGAFPDDRSTLSRAFTDEITALGEAATGAGDVSQLSLVDRSVDVIQRRYAAALHRGGHPALAVKSREAAEDKARAAQRSARNTLSSLAGSAYDNLGIGRPRVALKYLTRLADHLPVAFGPAEMLRDLLSLRAMEQGGGAVVGQ